MNSRVIRRIHRVTASIFCAAVVFYLFFQLNKGGPFRDINPFAEDPYDAVGSFTIQAALLIGLLTFARALRLRRDSAEVSKTRLILRGNTFVLSAILVTLVADAIAEVVHPSLPSSWGNILLLELVFMFLLTFACAIGLSSVFGRLSTVSPPHDLTPADGIDDLWTLVRVPVMKLRGILPSRFVDGVQRFNGDRLFAGVRWLHPRTHPWRFACGLGLLAGLGLSLVQLQEGLPPSLKVGLFLTGIFIFGELGAALFGFAVFGGYLGIRPSFGNGH